MAAKLIYGVSCGNASCEVAKNYMEYLACPDTDFTPCDVPDCEPITDTVLCTTDGMTLAVSDVTINSATATFTPPIHPYTLSLLKGNVLVTTIQNPVSPYTFTNLIPDSDYTVVLTNQCPYGDVKILEEPFHTLIACAVITAIDGTAEPM